MLTSTGMILDRPFSFQFQQPGVLSELYSYAHPDNEPHPEDYEQVMATYEYISTCSKLFEMGFLKKDCKIRNIDDDATQATKYRKWFQFLHGLDGPPKAGM
jgi:hypothetical protein